MPEVPELPKFYLNQSGRPPPGGTKSSWDPELAQFHRTCHLAVYKIKFLDPTYQDLLFSLKGVKKKYYTEYIMNFRTEFGSSCTVQIAILSF